MKSNRLLLCKKVICSYHLKTGFFWTIEAINDQIYNHLLECKKLSESQETRKKIEQLTTAYIFAWVFHQTEKYATLFYPEFQHFQNKDPAELEILSEQFEILKQNPKLVFQEVLKFSFTMKKKTCIRSMPFAHKYSLSLRSPQYWEFQWLNARNGKKEKGHNRKHYKTNLPFVINLLS